MLKYLRRKTMPSRQRSTTYPLEQGFSNVATASASISGSLIAEDRPLIEFGLKPKPSGASDIGWIYRKRWQPDPNITPRCEVCIDLDPKALPIEIDLSGLDALLQSGCLACSMLHTVLMPWKQELNKEHAPYIELEERDVGLFVRARAGRHHGPVIYFLLQTVEGGRMIETIATVGCLLHFR